MVGRLILDFQREREGEKEKGMGRELKGGKKKEKECGDKEEAQRFGYGSITTRFTPFVPI